MSTFAGHTYSLRRPAAWWREVALVAVLYVAYDVSRGLRNGTTKAADSNGSWLFHAEHSMHLDVERTLNQGLVHAPVLAVMASYFYATLHFVVTPTVLIWLYRRHPLDYGRARSSLAVATVMGLVVFWLVPTTPPRLLPGAGFHDTMAGVSGWGWWGGDGSAPRGLGSLTNQLAAMPSLHVGWALWAGYWIVRRTSSRYVRGLGIAYPTLTALVVMSTANHYLLDVVAGAADVALGAGIIAVWIRVRPVEQRRPAARPRAATRATRTRHTSPG
jgi:PAP2 superfamily